MVTHASTESAFPSSSERPEVCRWFDDWYDAMLAVVQRSVRKVLFDTSAAEETVQEVMLEIWMKSDRVSCWERGPEGWASTIARRRAIDRGRSDSSRVRREQQNYLREPDVVELVAEDVIVRLERDQLLQALKALNQKQRQVIELSFFGHRTHVEIARLLGIPLGTVKRRIRGGIQQLRPLLATS